jgi:hypothetical protein
MVCPPTFQAVPSVVYPPTYSVTPSVPFGSVPLSDCPPGMSVPQPQQSTSPPKMMEQPAVPANPPKKMEKPESPRLEAPKPKAVEPAAATEPMKEKPKVELATPAPAVPEPMPSKEKSKSPEIPPLNLPPIQSNTPKKEAALPSIPKFETPLATPEVATPKIEPMLTEVVPAGSENKIPKLNLPPAPTKPDVAGGDVTIPKLNLPPAPPQKVEGALAIPEVAIPKLELVPMPEKKPEGVKLPELKLPPITSESKYTPKESPAVRFVPVEGQRTPGNQVVRLYNYSDREFSMLLDGKATKLPAKSSVSVAMPDNFRWKLGEKSEMVTIPTDAAGMCVVIR